jgi:Fur family ferric uptake transcriptional regulator
MMPSAAAERLRAAGERVTSQRLAVADALQASRHPQSAEALWRRLRRIRGDIGRATVFRSLEALVGAGVARRLELEGHGSAYVACAAEHHHHLACTGCGRVLEIDESYLRGIGERVANDTGFVIDDARLDFYGRCADCATAA